MAELIITLFSADLQKNLYPANEFYKNSKLDAGVDINCLTIQIPQAGALPAVIKNPQTLPIPARIRQDDITSYAVDMYATEPDVVTDVNQAVLSYNKRAAILEDHQNVLNTRIADELAFLWGPTLAANILRTTGTGNTGTLLTGATGLRKEITYQDIINAATLMDRMNVPDDGNRRVLLTADQIGEIKKIDQFRDYDKSGMTGQLASGAVGLIQGFQIFKRSRGLAYNVGATAKKAVGSVVATTDNQAALFWHPSFVRRAEGNVQVYYEAKKVGYQGDMFNAALRGGGCIARLDQVGVVALVQQ